MSEPVASSVADLPPLREIIAAHGLQADKSFGQNFLLDLNLTDKIARAAGDLQGVHVLEVGPGPGGLTRSLVKSKAQDITAAEIDPRAVGALSTLVDAAAGRLKIVECDALVTPLRELVPEGPRAIIANLPYNVATPMLIKWLEVVHQSPDEMRVMVLMFQKEVAQRICAPPRSEAYGRLAIMVQWLCEARIAFDVPPSAFVPQPKIISSVVLLKPRAQRFANPPFKVMEQLVAQAFSQRRKMVRNTLAAYADHFEAAGIKETSRPEELDVSAFLKLAEAMVKAQQGAGPPG